ncbi:general odorant-binding protein 57e [Drosophila pseudoobscura]|uniref:General odorant-binding protein 57e n=1 Tax=Drosophila pseudoobscura pseudoobscura TaxID=46245 RepID=A0A6I8UUP3_DROPS|nr:general odorant-binding protein 57e [Drosophila pseudoobscura]
MSDQLLSLLLSVFLLYGYAHSNTAIFNPCRGQKFTTPEEQRAFLDNWLKNLEGRDLDRTFKCYATCMLFDMNIMDGSGELHMEKYLETEALEKSWPKSVANCRYEFADEMDICEYGFGMANCLMSLRAATTWE